MEHEHTIDKNQSSNTMNLQAISLSPQVFRFYVLAIVLFLYNPMMAQEEADKEKTWNFTAAPYLMFPNMNGEVGLGDQLVDVDASPRGYLFLGWGLGLGMLIEVDAGFMLFFEASNEKWVLNFDLLYMKLGADGETPLLGREADVELKQLAVTLNGNVQGNKMLIRWSWP